MLLATVGSLMFVIGFIWLIVVAVQTGSSTEEKVIWAAVNFLCQPLGGIVFYAVKRRGLVPLLLMVFGYILSGVGLWMRYGSVYDFLKEVTP